MVMDTKLSGKVPSRTLPQVQSPTFLCLGFLIKKWEKEEESHPCFTALYRFHLLNKVIKFVGIGYGKWFSHLVRICLSAGSGLKIRKEDSFGILINFVFLVGILKYLFNLFVFFLFCFICLICEQIQKHRINQYHYGIVITLVVILFIIFAPSNFYGHKSTRIGVWHNRINSNPCRIFIYQLSTTKNIEARYNTIWWKSQLPKKW